MIGLLGIISF